MITPNKKAKQLIDNYLKLFKVDLENSITEYEAAQCAKMVVDEIIADNPNIYDSDRLNFRYWIEVKNELLKHTP